MMKKNRLTLIIAIILLVAAGTLYLTRSASTLRKSVSEFSVDDTANVTRLFLADKSNNEVTLERSEDGRWLVNGKYTAQTAKISSFLKTLADLEVRAPVPMAARNNVITRMSVIARKIEIYQVKPMINLFDKVKLFPRETLAMTYYIGDVTQDNQGTYMLMEGADEPYIVHLPGFRGFVSTRYSTLAADWRDYTVFHTPINEIQSVQVEFPLNPGQSYRFDLQDNQNISLKTYPAGHLVAPYDTLRVLNFLTAFEDIRFESLLEHLVEKEYIDSVTASTPKTVITLTDRKGSVNKVKLFTKGSLLPLLSDDGDRMEPVDLERAYALVNEEEDFVLVQYFIFDRVTRPLWFFTGK